MSLLLINFSISSTLRYLNRLVSKYLARSELNAGQMKMIVVIFISNRLFVTEVAYPFMSLYVGMPTCSYR